MTASEPAERPVDSTTWDYDSASLGPRPLEELRELRSHWPLLMSLLEREFKVRYKRSVLGFVWTMLHPLLLFAVLALIFTGAFSSAAPHYPAFLLPGLLLWTFFSQTLSRTASEVAAGVDLWRRVKVPRTILAISNTFSGLINLIAATAIVLAVVVAMGGGRMLAILSLPLTLLLAACFTLGLSLMIAAVALYFPDVADMLQLILPAWMFATPIIYPQQIISRRVAGWIAWNPLTVFVESFRRPIYEGLAPGLNSFLWMTALALAVLLSGWLVFTLSADDAQARG
jgi:ABC-type polysaccharide/polyol phosphate export permease